MLCFRFLIVDIVLDDFGCHFVANTTDEVTATPEFACPQLAPQLWKALIGFSRRDAFHHLHPVQSTLDCVGKLLVAAGNLPERTRQCEPEQEMRHREQQVLLSFKPALGGVILATGAVSVLAGMIAVAFFVTVEAVVNVTAKDFRATLLNGCHRIAVAGEHLRAEFVAVLVTIPVKDVSQRYNTRPSMSLLILSAARNSALRVKCV